MKLDLVMLTRSLLEIKKPTQFYTESAFFYRNNQLSVNTQF